MSMIKILIADDHPIIAEGIRNALATDTSIEVVGIVNNGELAIQILKETSIDILILDMEMPVMNGLECIENIKALNLDVKIIVFSMYQEASLAKKLIDLGVQGYVLKTLEMDEFKLAIKRVNEGKEYYDSNLTKQDCSEKCVIRRFK